MYRGMLLLGALLLTAPGRAQNPVTDPEATRDLLESGMAAVEAAGELDEESRASVLELYRQALEQLEAAESNQLAAIEFQRAIETAPEEAAGIRAALADQQTTDPGEALGI